MNTQYKRHLNLSLLLVPILFLSGCLPGSEDKPVSSNTSATKRLLDDESEVLLTIDGQPVITVNSFNAEFDRLLEESPQLAQVLPFMPDAKSNFLQGMINQEVVDHYISKKGIDKVPAYVQEFEKTMDQVKKMLNTKYFSEKHPVQVTDAEIKAFYQENKNKLPDLMISQGGVKAEGVSFNKEDDAKAFLAKAKEAKADFEKVAKDGDFADDYRDFKMVNDQSLAIDPALRTKLINLKRFPTHELVKVGDVWWVVKAHSKEEPKYRPLDEQLKPSLEEYLKKQKQMELFEKVIDGYKKEFNVIVNDEPLKPKADEKAGHQVAHMASKESAAASSEPTEMSSKKELAEVEAVPQPATQTV